VGHQSGPSPGRSPYAHHKNASIRLRLPNAKAFYILTNNSKLKRSVIKVGHHRVGHQCNHNEFQCKSDNTCISIHKVQDGIIDCPDASDEKCRSDQFKCRCGFPKCIDRHLVGNGVLDCKDGSDEGQQLDCHYKKHKKKTSGDGMTASNATSAQLLHKESISSVLSPKLSESHISMAFSSDHVSQSTPNQILVSQQMPDKQTNIQLDGLYHESHHSVHSSQAMTLQPSVPSFVELTGTFVPFEQLSQHSAFPAQPGLPALPPLSAVHYYTNDAKLTTQDSLIEITGTFIPEMESILINSTLDNHKNPNSKPLDKLNANHYNYITITGTKEMFATNDNTFEIITGTHSNSKDTNKSVTIRLDGGELAVVVPTPVLKPHIKNNSTNNKLLYATIETNATEKNNTFDKNYLNPKPNVQTVTGRRIGEGVSVLSDQFISANKADVLTKPSIISLKDRFISHNRDEESIASAGTPVLNTESLALRKAPVYTHSKLDQNKQTEDTSDVDSFQESQSLSSSAESRRVSSIEPSLSLSSSSPQLVRPTGLLSTITGTNELDGSVTEWTTSVIGTYIRGTYAHILQSTSSIYAKHIETTKTAPFDDFSNDRTERPVFVESPINSDALSESIEIDLSESHRMAILPTRVTITSGFILPSVLRSPQFVNQSNVTPVVTKDSNPIQSSHNRLLESSLIDSNHESYLKTPTLETSAELRLKTYFTRFTYYTTVVKEGQTLVNSRIETSSNVKLEAVTDTHEVLPTRPLTTYYTTYTYFTTFKRGETEFVRSREEIVTNIMQNTDNPFLISSSEPLITKSIEPSVSLLANNKLLNSLAINPSDVNNNLKPTINRDIESDMTTLTYFTTHFKDGKPSIKSRKVVVSKTVDTNQIPQNEIPVPVHAVVKPSVSSRPNASSLSTPLDESLISSLNIADLLSGVAVPITHYTTFTYYTTFFRDQSSSIKSRTEVVSDVKTGTINLGLKTPIPQITPTINTLKISNTRADDLGSIKLDKDFDQLIAAGAENRPIVITPVTRLSTTTYFTTLLIPGEDSTVISSTRVLSDIYIPGPSDTLPVPLGIYDYHSMSLDPSMTERHEAIAVHSTVDDRVVATESLPDISNNPETVFTTYTYITTRFPNGYPIVDTSYETFSNLVTKFVPTLLTATPDSHSTQSFGALVDESNHIFTNQLFNRIHESSIITPSRSRKPIVVTRTRVLGSGGLQPIPAGPRRPVVIVRKRPDQEIPKHIPLRISGQFRSEDRGEGVEPHIRIVPPKESVGHYHNVEEFSTTGDVGRRFPKVTPTPVTFYTTYTYFTTELSDGIPVVKSREQLYSTVITNKVLPTRTIPADAIRHKRSAVFDVNDYKNIIANKSVDTSKDEKQDLEANPMEEVKSDPYIKNDLNELVVNKQSISSKDLMSENVSQKEDNQTADKKTGIITEKTEIKGLQTLITEIYGTLINGIYAQFAVTRTVLDSKPTTSSPIKSISLFSEDSFRDSIHVFSINGNGIVVIKFRDNINNNKTTIYTTEIRTTSINGLLAHIGHISSTVIESWTPLPGLASAVYSTQTLDNSITLYTTEFYTTEINGFTAHYSRSTSNIIAPVVSTDTQLQTIESIATEKTKTVRPFIHFPTPVRFLFSSKLTSTSTPASTVASTITAILNPDLSSTDFPMNNILDNSYESDEYYDETAERGEEHTPRSRPIREKDSQPLLEYEYEDIEPSQPTIEPPKPQTLNYIPYRGAARAGASVPTRTAPQRQLNTGYNARRAPAGFGQRVGANVPQDAPKEPLFEYPVRDVVPPQSTQRQTQERAKPGVTRGRRPVMRTEAIAPTRAYNEFKATIPEYRTVDRDNRQEVPEYVNNRPEDEQNNRFNQNANQNNRRQQNGNNRLNTRRRLPQTTTPAPRTHPILPNRGQVRLNKKYSGRPRYTPNPTRDSSDESIRYRNDNNNDNRRRAQQRGRTPKTTLLYLNQPKPSVYTDEYYSATSDVVTTPALPKVPVTITSIVTTVKTIPIYHGFKTSYATLTTTTLNTSLIQTDQYETSVNPIDGITRSIFTQSRDPLEPTKVTEVLITTSVLYDSAARDTRTAGAGRPILSSYSLFISTNSFITTQTLTTTTVVSLSVRDETILSTLTLTSLTESTVTSTQTISIPVPITQAVPNPVPQPITTLLTLTLTGDGGDITQLVTAVTVPIQPVFHTKVERDVKATRSPSAALMQQTLGPNLNTIKTSDTFDYISVSFKTVDQMMKTFDPLFISTIFKGPETEIYEASATVVQKIKHKDKEHKDIHKNKNYKSSQNKYETSFKKRKLQQFAPNDNNYGYPFRQIDYSTVNLKPQTISLQVDQNEPIPDFLGFDSPRFQSLPQSAPQPFPQPVLQRTPASRQPSFQRIRINKPLPSSPPILSTPPSTPFTSPNEPQELRFQRLVGLDRLPESNVPFNTSPLRLTSQGNFRRVPVFNNQIQSLSPLRPPIIEPTVTDVYATSVLLSPTFGPLVDDQRQPTFRRVRPIQAQPPQPPQPVPNARRIKPKVKVSSRRPVSTPLPTSVIVSSVEIPFLPVSDMVDIPRRSPVTRKPVLENEGIASPPLITSSRVRLTTPISLRETTTDTPRRVVRIRRPNQPTNTNKKRIVLPKNPQSLEELQARGPVPPRDDEPHKNNAVDNDEFTNFGTRLNENGDKTIEIHTPTLPLTYFTTFTYLTTVVRGQHTAHLTRESITSTVTTEALDKSIVDLIQNSDGVIKPTKVVDLGTKTKGVTTTIVNMVSKVKVFNDDLYKVIHSTKPLSIDTTITENNGQPIHEPSSSHIVIQPTAVHKEVVNTKPIENNYKLSELDKKPKKQITSFTYYYTLYDKLSTKYSTRSEETTSDVAPNAISSLRLDSTINSHGLLSVGAGAETVHLGSRELGGLTTEVNLALNTYIKFDGINNAVVEPLATRVLDPLSSESIAIAPQSVTPNPLESTHLSASFSSSVTSDPISGISTPTIPLETPIKLETSHTRKPLKLMSSAVVIRDPLRSKFDAFGRPGVRVRVKPMPEKSTQLLSSTIDDITKSSETEVLATPVISAPVEGLNEETTSDVTPSKKRIAVTLRRPFGGISRVSSRRPQRVSVSTKPRFVVVTRTGPLPTVQSTARVKISSRVFKSPAVEMTTSPSVGLIAPTTSVNDNGETLIMDVTTLPVVFGLDTSYQTVTLTSTLTPPTTPLPSEMTVFETTTHTYPFTVGDQTIYTTVEETNSRVITRTLDTVYPSDAARANKLTTVSNGVTIIVGDNGLANRTLPSGVTLQPTLVTGAVHMKDGIKTDTKQSEKSLVTLFDTRTLFTTFTYFTTFYTEDTSIISSSEQTVSNVVTIPYTHIVDSSSKSISPTVVYETSERLRTETVYSTYTYFATLFNGSTSTITPLEEIKTEYMTYKEPLTVTRTIVPTTTEQASLITRTYFTTYTNLVTFFQNNKPVTSTLEETVSSEVVYTVPKIISSSSSSSSSIRPTAALDAPVLRTRSTYTTLTHYITLFSGSQTILSSIEEISPTVVTETSGQTMESTTDFLPNIQFTHPSQSASKQSKDLYSALVPSISTHFTTHTYFTTLFSGTTSTVISRKQTSSSLVTLFVPHSVTSSVRPSISIDSSESSETDLENRSKTEYMIEATPVFTTPVMATDGIIDEERLKSIQPSLRIDSSSYEVFDSSMISKVFEDLKSSEGLTEEQLSSVVAEVGASTTILDGSTIVFFTNFILPSTASDGTVISTDANNIAKGPAGDLVSSLLNNADMSLLNDLLASRISSVRSTASPVYITPHMTTDPGSQMTAIKPGSVIELSDLLDGANLAGNIGEAIKDIVHILAKAPKGKNGTQEVDRISPSKELPPREGAAVSNTQDPVYIPLGAMHKPSTAQTGDRITKQSGNTRRVYINPSSTAGLEGTSLPTSAIVSQIGFDANPIESSLETNKKVLQISIDNQRPTPVLTSKVIKTINPMKTAISRVSSGATTIFFTDSTQMPSFIDSNSPIESTRYVTSVESSTRTLTLTTTKVYYTRDSPLTITSVLTTTIPPRTFVSTIIGTRTILGTAGETQTDAVVPTQVDKGVVTPTTTTRRPTRKPGTGPFRAPTRVPETPKPFKTAAPRPRVPYKPPPPPQPPILSGVSEAPYVPNKRPTAAPTPKPTTRPSILDIDQCKPGCNAANKEVCKEMNGKYRCDCRQGFIRRQDDLICQELQNYVVVVRVMKVGESEVTWFQEFTNNSSDEYQNLAKMAKNQVDSAYMGSDVKESYVGADVLGIDKVADGGNGVLVNLTVHLTKRHDLDEDLLREKLIKKLEQNSELLPNPEYVSADVEDVIDFDECSSEQYNDCAASARCINEPGTYRCECLNGYPDLDISLPGRVCASEIKGCEFCHGRGDCIRDESGLSNTCKCNRMYLGRRCQINGLLLAIVLPIAAILCIVSICCIVYCCRKWRKRTISKGFRNLSSFGPTVIGGTLDRKAMLETSSESSDHLRSHVYDGPAMLPNDPNGTDSQRRRESEPSLDRSMGSVGGPYNSLPPQIVIPRAGLAFKEIISGSPTHALSNGLTANSSHNPADTSSSDTVAAVLIQMFTE
ncbi:unnamed protein product, partial [Oppiella nova]